MRYILPLLLAGCFSAYPESVPANFSSEMPSIAPIQRASGTSEHNVQWTCSQEDVNDHSIWISCDFKNTGSEQVRTCIDISYTRFGCTEENPSGSIVDPRRVCTRELNPGDTSEGYASYFEGKASHNSGFTKLVQNCGRTMSNCMMETLEVKR